MEKVYRLFGNELSPYSVKVRSYFRFKGIPHEWIVRNASNEEEFQRYAKLPLIPLVVTPDQRGLQDSTPIIDTFEAQFPEPSIRPADPRLAFLAALVEEYADEWLNKPMFHYRWFYEADAASAAERLAASLLPDVERQAAVAMIRNRMVSRLAFVGSSEVTRNAIEASYLRLLDFLQAHLAGRSYVLGGRPSLADFGLFGQLYQCSTDPTPGAILRHRAPSVMRWIQRMEAPTIEGAWEPFSVLAEALRPLLQQEIGNVFFPWTLANERALQTGANEFEVHLAGERFVQTPQKYHAKSLAMLRQRFALLSPDPELHSLLEATGCLAALVSPREAAAR